jgi:hypothetical protein
MHISYLRVVASCVVQQLSAQQCQLSGFCECLPTVVVLLWTAMPRQFTCAVLQCPVHVLTLWPALATALPDGGWPGLEIQFVWRPLLLHRLYICCSREHAAIPRFFFLRCSVLTTADSASRTKMKINVDTITTNTHQFTQCTATWSWTLG